MSMFGIVVSGRLVNFLSLVFVANIVFSFYVDYTQAIRIWSLSEMREFLGEIVNSIVKIFADTKI